MYIHFHLQNHTSNARMLSCLCTEFTVDEDMKEDVVARTSRLCEDYEQFLTDSEEMVNKINKKQVAYKSTCGIMSTIELPQNRSTSPLKFDFIISLSRSGSSI